MDPETRAARLQQLAASGTRLTVRDFIAMWGARGRGSQVGESIRLELRRLRLATEPPFDFGNLDTEISVVGVETRAHTDRLASAEQANARYPETEIEPTSSEGDAPERPKLRVGRIPSALGGVTSIESTATVGRAQTIMMRHDYSQLAVIHNDQFVGVVSWESIAQASLRSRPSLVRDVMVTATTLEQDADLLASIGLIVQVGYVVVLDPAGKPSGVVTTADLALQFDRLAGPFLLVGECEQELKDLLDRHFTADELHGATRYKRKDRPGASAMTLGDMKGFLQDRKNWNRINWRISQSAFIDWVDVLRQIRNEIAHFSQDDSAALAGLSEVRTLTRLLRMMSSHAE